MFKDEWVADADIQTEKGISWMLKYYVRETEKTVYDIKIEKYAANGTLVETEATKALTASYNDALALARRFAQGTVTPMVLLEMAEEWV